MGSEAWVGDEEEAAARVGMRRVRKG